MHPYVHVSTIAKMLKQPNCPSTDEWIRKMWCMCLFGLQFCPGTRERCRVLFGTAHSIPSPCTWAGGVQGKLYSKQRVRTFGILTWSYSFLSSNPHGSFMASNIQLLQSQHLHAFKSGSRRCRMHARPLHTSRVRCVAHSLLSARCAWRIKP